MGYIVFSLLFSLLFSYLSMLGFPFGGWLWPAGLLMSIFWGYMALSNLMLALLRIASDFFSLPAGRLFKRADGSLRPLFRLCIYPYLRLERAAWKGYRGKSKEPLFSKVNDMVFIGSHPRNNDRDALMELGVGAILDVNCELKPAPYEKSNSGMEYICIPVLDGCTPSQEQLAQGVQWAIERLEQDKKVLVHCTFGHGRSAAMVACILVRSGMERDLASSLERLISTNRSIFLTHSQKRAVNKFLSDTL